MSRQEKSVRHYRAEQKTNIQNSIMRILICSVSLLIQIAFFLVLAFVVRSNAAWIQVVVTMAALVLCVYIDNKAAMPPEFKTPLTMMILAFPIVGLTLYGCINRKGPTFLMKKRFRYMREHKIHRVSDDHEALALLEKENPAVAGQFRYLSQREKFSVFHDSDISYYADAAKAYEDLVTAVRDAKEFVFIEYHAIEDSEAFAPLKEILKRKAAGGVEVRILYDDVGSIGFLNNSFKKKMEASGIQCRVFNPITPAFRFIMNNRDHRKITVVDGKAAFTGGYNLADEYFGCTHPYGEWKDAGVRILGNAANSFTLMFLEMWNCSEKIPEDFSPYLRTGPGTGAGFVQPYADNPLDDSFVGENAYMNMIKSARKTLYVTTPYLIIGDAMRRELTLAAGRGVDVRIVTPGIPDKKVIYRITRSYYDRLVRGGVRIYEYTPGFLHAKQMVSDGEAAIVGTINMDYRSFYHHFEDAVLMYGTPAVAQVSQGFADIFARSREVTADYSDGRKRRLVLLDALLHLIAPLL